MKHKKIIIILLLFVLIIIGIIVAIILLNNSKPENYNSEQIIKYLEKKGYERDTNINMSWADISDKNNNANEERKEQKQAFVEWCDEIKLTRKQICNMLDYYYKYNIDNFRIKQNTY